MERKHKSVHLDVLVLERRNIQAAGREGSDFAFGQEFEVTLFEKINCRMTREDVSYQETSLVSRLVAA